MKKSLTQGFTLIELLVVIAIIGILAAVVLVAINPAERFKEANDSKVKSNVGQVATALESCFSANGGKYAAAVCDSTTNLKSAGYLKSDLSSTVSVATNSTNSEAVAYGTVTAQSNGGNCSVSGQVAYVRYDTSTGSTTNQACTATIPTPL